MVISEKQHEANQQNAQQSTGPKSPEGKAAVRLNALKYGLRARDLLIFDDDPAEYQQLSADLEADWQPQNRTERFMLEEMCISQWLLARIARGESRIYQAEVPLEKQLAMLRDVCTQRAHLQRSFRTAMLDLERLQMKREARRERQQPAQTAQAAPAPAPPPAKSPAPPPAYVMSEEREDHPVYCATATPDTR